MKIDIICAKKWPKSQFSGHCEKAAPTNFPKVGPKIEYSFWPNLLLHLIEGETLGDYTQRDWVDRCFLEIFISGLRIQYMRKSKLEKNEKYAILRSQEQFQVSLLIDVNYLPDQ